MLEAARWSSSLLPSARLSRKSPRANPAREALGQQEQLSGGFPVLPNMKQLGRGDCARVPARALPAPTSTPRRGPAPHAVLPIPGGAVDGGLSLERVPVVAGVCHRYAIEEFIQQPARVLPVGNVRRRLTRDTCRDAK